MPFYHRLGSIPPKRHIQYRNDQGQLYAEEVMGTDGFSGIQSILYHFAPPTLVRSTRIVEHEKIEISDQDPLAHHHILGSKFLSSGDPLSGRKWMLHNSDIKIGLATPTETQKYFYKNGTADELLFVHKGSGVLRTQFGKLEFGAGDYIIIPVGTIYLLECTAPCKFLVVESRGRIEVPKRYRNSYGQFLEHSPFCERDIRVPGELESINQRGEFPLRIKTGEITSELILAQHPFGVVGWDGYLYPWIFNIRNFEPITGRIHQPPPVHQTFYADGFVVCSFCPRLFDYHPQAVPVPYNHSNVNSDEVLYYVEGNFMSRKGVSEGSFTHHPAGIPHGPHPGTLEASLGQKETKELAVMIDTFAPLKLTKLANSLLDPAYPTSWL